MEKCNVDCYGKCQKEIYLDHKCILHCKKNDYSSDWNSGLLSSFYDEFINYTVEQLFRHKDLIENKFSSDEIRNYLKSNNFENDEYNQALTNTIFIPSCIHFPKRDGRDTFDYLRILNLFGQIHFNYCEFYLSFLDLKNIECFFQDCKFHDRWTLYDYGLLENEDNVIYQACEFNEAISNYTPERSTELATYKYSQFDYTCQFKKNIEFYRCKFEEKLFNTNQNNYLEENSFKKIIIDNCVFEQKLKLNNYCIECFKCKDTVFNDKFEFKENKAENFVVDNTNFRSLVDLFGCSFFTFKIYKSIFDDFVGFENCIFGSSQKSKSEIAIFKYATFTDFINFRNTQFLSGLDIEHINLKEAPNFLNSKIELQNTNRETFRLLKYSFEKIGNNIEANKYFIKEMKKYREELTQKPLRGHIQEKLVFTLNDIFSSFGQSYLKPIFFLFLFAILYHLVIYGYEENLLYRIYEPANIYIQNISNFLNQLAKDILPFKKILKSGLEFISLLFYIIFSILIWQTIVSIKRYTKR